MSGSPVMVVFMILLFVVVASFITKNNFSQVFQKVKTGDIQLGTQVEIDGPIIRYREKGKKKIEEIQMKIRKFRIGSGSQCELRLNVPSVEEIHAIIYKKVKGDKEYYQLINYGKVNPVQYYNPETEQYEMLRYRESVILDERTGFYIGKVKIVAILQEKRIITDPFDDLDNKKQNSKEEKRNNEKAKREKRREEKRNEEQMDIDKDEEPISYTGKRVVSVIIPSKDELEL